MLEGLRREVVLDDDRRIEGGKINLMNFLVDSRFRLEDHPSLVRGPQLRDVPDALCIPFPEWDCYASSQGLIDLVRGDKVPGVKREVRFGERPESLEAMRTPFSPPSV